MADVDWIVNYWRPSSGRISGANYKVATVFPPMTWRAFFASKRSRSVLQKCLSSRQQPENLSFSYSNPFSPWGAQTTIGPEATTTTSTSTTTTTPTVLLNTRTVGPQRWVGGSLFVFDLPVGHPQSKCGRAQEREREREFFSVGQFLSHARALTYLNCLNNWTVGRLLASTWILLFGKRRYILLGWAVEMGPFLVAPRCATDAHLSQGARLPRYNNKKSLEFFFPFSRSERENFFPKQDKQV